MAVPIKVRTFAPAKPKKHALVAQLVEHLTLNQGVQGSNPCRRTRVSEESSMETETVPFFVSLHYFNLLSLRKVLGNNYLCRALKMLSKNKYKNKYKNIY